MRGGAILARALQEKGVELAGEKRERAIETLRQRALLDFEEQQERLGGGDGVGGGVEVVRGRTPPNVQGERNGAKRPLAPLLWTP